MTTQRVRIVIEGVVQGVGFRPFVFQVAMRFALRGWILNDNHGVEIEVEGAPDALRHFISVLQHSPPPLARIDRFHLVDIPSTGVEESFTIKSSRKAGSGAIPLAADAHVCAACLQEMGDPEDRRYRYPFINCTECGPRFSLVTAIPYDRPNTTMVDFTMCTACRAEYEDVASRRFHAQPIACPECGPRLLILDPNGVVIDSDPLEATILALKAGKIVAIKGLGGYHLAVDASQHHAVERLRQRKLRDDKPFAVMSSSIAVIRTFAHVSHEEELLLNSAERPIVLLKQQFPHPLSAAIAPGNRFFGIMLPYTPLHHLLLEDFTALVMTSGNRSDEPIVYDDSVVVSELGGIADLILTHNRRIHLRLDDSIICVHDGIPRVLRRARGFVPRGIELAEDTDEILALGGELKNTLCFTRGRRAYLSQHLGDLTNPHSCAAHAEMIEHLQQVLEIRPRVLAHDLHPDYHSTIFAEDCVDCDTVAVQHHHAHMASCLAEHRRTERAIGVIFDGLGYGADGRLWGGEFLLGDTGSFQRIGHFDWFSLPGGDVANRQPWRMAISLLHRVYGRNLPLLPVVAATPQLDLDLLLTMLDKGINSPLSSSCGRLFDAVAALLELRRVSTFEGQAAMELEAHCSEECCRAYPFEVVEVNNVMVVDHRQWVMALVEDIQRGTQSVHIAESFHRTVAEIATAVCLEARRRYGLNLVACSGGVFQNRRLTTLLEQRLRGERFDVLTHSLVPANDGGLSLGQAVVAATRYRNRSN